MLFVALGFGTDARAQLFSENKIVPSDPVDVADFGFSVSMSGDKVLIGAPEDDAMGIESGAAYIYTRNPRGHWIETAKLMASDGTEGDKFGWAVYLQGNRAIIGSVLDDIGVQDSGSAYIFERQQDGSWIEVAKVIPNDIKEFNHFGSAFSMTGNRVLIGSYSAYNLSTDSYSGAAYIFDRMPDGAWVQVARMNASDGETTDFFSTSLVLTDDTAFIGANFDDNENGTNAGSVYVFERNPDDTWSEVAKLLSSDKDESRDLFGMSLSIDGDRLIVGTEKIFDGTAYIFEQQVDKSWAEVAILKPADSRYQNYFGISVVVEGDRAYVRSRGGLHVFERKSQEHWEEVRNLVPFNDVFGFYDISTTIALSKGRILVGARSDTGVAYIFEPCEEADTTYRHISCLADKVHALFDDGMLNGNQRSILLAHMKQTLSAIQKEEDDYIIASLTDFNGHVKAFVHADEISEQLGNNLIKDANEIIGMVEENILSSIDWIPTDKLVIRSQEISQLFELHRNHPNPFNPSTTISFSMPEQAQVRLIVYDMLGREVERLVDGMKEAGYHEVTFDAGGFPSGTYLYRLETPASSFTQTMLFLK